MVTEESLKALAEAGLDEIRFNLAASNCSDKVIKNIGIAKKYIKSVGIESPMTPEFYTAFLKKTGYFRYKSGLYQLCRIAFK